jgi:hypothetical protein
MSLFDDKKERFRALLLALAVLLGLALAYSSRVW